jgi:hypothetical protein
MNLMGKVTKNKMSLLYEINIYFWTKYFDVGNKQTGSKSKVELLAFYYDWHWDIVISSQLFLESVFLLLFVFVCQRRHLRSRRKRPPFARAIDIYGTLALRSRASVGAVRCCHRCPRFPRTAKAGRPSITRHIEMRPTYLPIPGRG